MDAKLSTNIKCAFILQITKGLRSLICYFLIDEQYPKGFIWDFVCLFFTAVECEHTIILLKMVSCKWDLGQ